MRFEAIEFPHGNCVVEKPGDQILAAFASIAEARMYAETLTRWIESRPEPHEFRVYRDFEGPPRPTPTEYDLLSMIDRIYDPERRLDLLEEAIRREVAELL